MIDWRKVAEQHGLSAAEFKEEVYSVAAIVAAIDIDNQEGGNAVKFTCSDNVGNLELIVRRVSDDQNNNVQNI